MLAIKIGLIGAGRMATALGRGFVAAKLVPPNRAGGQRSPGSDSRGLRSARCPARKSSPRTGRSSARCDVVILAVKPQTMKTALDEIRGVDATGRARGFDRRRRDARETRGGTRGRAADRPRDAEHALPDRPRREWLCARADAPRRKTGELVAQLLSAVGVAYEVPESQLDAVTGLSGSGPAFVYTMIELLAEGGKAVGLPAELAADAGGSHRGRGRGNGARHGRDAGRAPRSRDEPGRNDPGRAGGFGRKWIRAGRGRRGASGDASGASNWENRPEDCCIMSIFCRIDDKHIPLYRVMWVSATPHFCGEEDCVREGYYEIRLEQGESVWGSVEERDKMLESLEAWHGDMDVPDDDQEQEW